MLYEDTTIIEVVCGREGLWGLKNTNLIPLGGALTLRNATLFEHSFRTGGGRQKFGTPPTASRCLAAVDYWPTPGVTQRTVAVFADGSIWKDNGAGGGWVQLKSGLNMTGAIPMFCPAGFEASGKNRKLFYADGINAPMYLDGNAAVMTTLNPATQAAADWVTAGAYNTNVPSWFLLHNGYLWAGGGILTPHTIYRCTALADQTDFRTATTFSFSIFAGESERITGGLSYKGGMVLFKYPNFTYFYNTVDPVSANWGASRVAQPGGVSVYGHCLVEDDILWVSSDASLHLLSATLAYGSVKASDLTHRKLSSYPREHIEASVLSQSQMAYYSERQELHLACAGSGQTAKNMRLVLDLNRKFDQGERWFIWDRDRNEALFLRKKDNVERLYMVDEVGQVWQLDIDARAILDAAGVQVVPLSQYTFEWFLKDDDFSALISAWHGRRKNLRFIQVEYYPRTATSMTIEVYRDGQLRQSIVLNLVTTGAQLGTAQATLPFMLGVSAIAMSIRRKMQGQCVRLALRGLNVTPDALGAEQDFSMTRILIGLDLAG